MLAAQRKDLVLTTVRCEGRVVAKDLAAELELSEDTIRRDLREPAVEGLPHRVHDGAPPASPADVAARTTTTTGTGTGAEAGLARAEDALVRPGQIVAIDGGTTARRLPPELRAAGVDVRVAS